MIITQVKEQERNSANDVKKLLFLDFIVCIYIDILPFTYFPISKGIEMCMQYYCDLWGWMLSRNKPLVNKNVMKSVPCWFYYPIDFVSLANTVVQSHISEASISVKNSTCLARFIKLATPEVVER